MEHLSENKILIEELNKYKEEVKKLEKKIKNPLVADIVFAVITSVVLNSISNMHDHYELMQYIKYCLIDTVGYMPVGGILAYFVYELNNEKREKIKELNEKISTINNALDLIEKGQIVSGVDEEYTIDNLMKGLKSF